MERLEETVKTVSTSVKRSSRRYVPRAGAKGGAAAVSAKSAQSPVEFYKSVTRRGDVRVILDKLAKA